jgi:hypothetical protein
MALGAVLVDRARIINWQAASSVKVEGSTQFASVKSEWFKARLVLPAAEQDNTPGDAPLMRGIGKGRVRVIQGAQLLFAIKDAAGNPIEVHFDAKVEVDSKQLGRAVYRVMGEPEKLRKKRTVIGHLASIERAIEGQFEAVGT